MHFKFNKSRYDFLRVEFYNFLRYTTSILMAFSFEKKTQNIRIKKVYSRGFLLIKSRVKIMDLYMHFFLRNCQ